MDIWSEQLSSSYSVIFKVTAHIAYIIDSLHKTCNA